MCSNQNLHMVQQVLYKPYTQSAITYYIHYILLYLGTCFPLLVSEKKVLKLMKVGDNYYLYNITQ